MEQPEIAAPWKQEELAQVPKKDIVEFLQKHGNNAFLQRHSLKGKLQNVAKNVNKVHCPAVMMHTPRSIN